MKQYTEHESGIEAQEIVTRVTSGDEVPANWRVFPLLRHKVILAITGWVFGILIGFGLFAVVWSIVVPYNYQHGVLPAVFSTVLLGILLFIGLGSAWTLYADIRRLL